MRIDITKVLWVTAVGLLVVGLAVLIWDPTSSSGSDAAVKDGGTDQVVEHIDGVDEHDDADDHADAKMFVDPAGEERVVTMRTEDFRFVPETVTVKVGETIRLRLENHDPVLHDYTTDEDEFIVMEASGASHGDHDAMAADDDDREMDPEAQVSLQPLHIAAEANDYGELVFEATEAGEYEFYCSVPGHREAGMVGKIVIEA